MPYRSVEHQTSNRHVSVSSVAECLTKANVVKKIRLISRQDIKQAGERYLLGTSSLVVLNEAHRQILTFVALTLLLRRRLSPTPESHVLG